jgi:hypothetical protein
MQLIDLRYQLSMDRIREIPGENAVSADFVPFFESGAKWFLLIDRTRRELMEGQYEAASLDVMRSRSRALYEEILPANYKKSYANPEYASDKLGKEFGPLFAALRYEMRSVIPFVFRSDTERVLIRAELFLEMYTAFSMAYREEGKAPSYTQALDIMRQYLMDYMEDELTWYLRDKLVKGSERVSGLLTDPFYDLRDLYMTGEYVSESEEAVAAYIAGLPDEKIDLIAFTITDGFQRGFINYGKNLASKKNVAMIFHLGFERIFRACALNFRKMGLSAIVSAEVPTLFHAFHQGSMGISGADPNPQYYYDHREDLALFMDEAFHEKRIESLRNAYKQLHSDTVLYAGPAVIEVFGAAPFSPQDSPCAPRFNDAQKKLRTDFEIRSADLYSEAVIAKDRSFTVIDFPLPSIAGTREGFEEIFDSILSINTLDNALFQKIQGKMVDALSAASHIEVRGGNGNRTALTVRLQQPADPDTEASFENCTADVNIPVGEVFTTPVLEGTDGVLHVTGVYLEGLYFKDLALTFKDGRVVDYSCGNFDSETACRSYIEENILFHHKNLPMGECAIGTNTTAFAAAVRYGISDRLPILIAEKTGPHFAVGDTCYCRDEELHVYNPDGKEIIAKDNSVSILRKTDPEKAYFGCHTDITIPYDELASYVAVRPDGVRIPIIENGRFVLDGTQILNKPLDELTRN